MSREAKRTGDPPRSKRYDTLRPDLENVFHCAIRRSVNSSLMNLPKTILVASDFSPTSDYAADYAMVLAGELGADLHVLHVVDVPSLLYQPATHAFDQQLTSMAETEMAKRFPASRKDGVDVTVAIERGSAYSGIIDYATEHKVDMIVLGTHGKGPISRTLLGGVADKVVRKASCPVLTIRSPE